MDCLYASGFRGFNLRNSGPSDLWERAMGINNEGMFTFTTSAATMNVIKTGLTKVNAFLVNGQKPSCSSNNGGSNSGSTSSYKVNVISGSNDWWTQIEVLPTSSVQTVVLKCGSASTSLERPAWSQTQFVKGLSAQCPMGSDIQVIVNSKYTYPIKYTVGASSANTLSDMPPLFQNSPTKYQVAMNQTTRRFSRFTFTPIYKLLDGENIDMAVMKCGHTGSTSLKQISENTWEGEMQNGFCPIGANVQLFVVLRNGHVERYDIIYGYDNVARLY